MVTRDFSGDEVAKVLVNKGDFAWVRTAGDHMILKWEPPEDHAPYPCRVTIASERVHYAT